MNIKKKRRVNATSDYALFKKTYSHSREFKDKDKQSGSIRDLIDNLENKGISYEIYDNKTNNGCTIFYNDDGTVITSAQKPGADRIKTKIWNAASAKMKDMGFLVDEIPDYLFVDVKKANDYICVEVRAELTYNELTELIDELDPIVQSFNYEAEGINYVNNQRYRHFTISERRGF